ncbi:MAG TPA: DNA-formamidopyrimidine glycosylase family protein, partial [Gemmatales bacterium]|nr:DNA-formamidopyrimidine glycosylase family protein [Gemmatales bacterium]
MPELPEVETVVRFVRPQLVGRTINQISTSPKNLHMAWQNYWNSEVVGKRIQAVDRRGKWILLALSDGKSHLVVHLGMTGRLVVVPRSEPVMKHTHLIFSLDRGKWHLRYQDPRRFGSVR